MAFMYLYVTSHIQKNWHLTKEIGHFWYSLVTLCSVYVFCPAPAWQPRLNHWVKTLGPDEIRWPWARSWRSNNNKRGRGGNMATLWAANNENKVSYTFKTTLEPPPWSHGVWTHTTLPFTVWDILHNGRQILWGFDFDVQSSQQRIGRCLILLHNLLHNLFRRRMGGAGED